MEGFLLKKGRGESSFGRANWKKRWFTLDGATLTYFDDFSIQKDEPVNEKGTMDIQGCKVEVVNHKDKKFAFAIKHSTKKPLMMAADDERTLNMWIGQLNAAINGDNRPTMPPQECAELLDIAYSSDLTIAQTNKAYRKMCLRVHPDKGGDILEFKRVQEAFESLTDRLEEDERSRMYRTITYSATIQKGPKGVGFGMLVAEDVKRKAISVKEVMPTMDLKDITSEARGSVLKGDTIVRIAKDAIEGWPLARVVQRLNDFRVPVGSSVKLTLSRQVSADGKAARRRSEFDIDQSFASTDEEPSPDKNVPVPTNSAPPLKVFHVNVAGDDYSAVAQAEIDDLRAENSVLRKQLQQAQAEVEEARAVKDGLNEKISSMEQQAATLQQQISLLSGAKEEAVRREEHAHQQMSQMLLMSEMTSDQLMQSMRDIIDVSSRVKSGTTIPLPAEAEAYLESLGYGEAVVKAGSLQAAQRKAMSAAASLDHTGTMLRKWEMAGDSAADKLRRLEERLQRLARSSAGTENQLSAIPAALKLNPNPASALAAAYSANNRPVEDQSLAAYRSAPGNLDGTDYGIGKPKRSLADIISERKGQQ